MRKVSDIEGTNSSVYESFEFGGVPEILPMDVLAISVDEKKVWDI